MFLHTADASVVSNAPSQPLVRPGANNVRPALFQEGLELQQQGPGQKKP